MITTGFLMLVMLASLAVGAAVGALFMQATLPQPRSGRRHPVGGRHRA